MPWLPLQSSSVSPSHSARAAFGSIGLPTTRPLSTSMRATWAAAAKAASTAAASP